MLRDVLDDVGTVGVHLLRPSWWCRAQDLGFGVRVSGSGLRVSGFRVAGSGFDIRVMFRVQGLGFGVRV